MGNYEHQLPLFGIFSSVRLENCLAKTFLGTERKTAMQILYKFEIITSLLINDNYGSDFTGQLQRT